MLRCAATVVAACAAFGAAASPVLASGPTCSAGGCSETFDATGAVQTWTVPAGVTTATFTLDGAQGADLPDDQIRASIDRLSREERDRLDALALEVFKDHSDLFDADAGP